MIELLFFVIGVAVGAACLWMFLNPKLVSSETELRMEKERNAAIKEDSEKMLRQQMELSEKQLQAQTAALQEKITNITNELLKSRSKDLEEQNARQMKPLEEQLERLQKLMNETRVSNAKDTESVKTQIADMMRRSKEMSDETSRLANALTHRSKFQGDLGESILDNVLTNAGLREGRDYEIQEFIRDDAGNTVVDQESGRKMQPDVILHFPDNKDAIIDSKVSLTAYTKYVNAETEQEKEIYLKQHLDSVRKHVKELARKDYSKFIEKPRATFDFVIMFMPFEGAFQSAINADPQLWSDAFNMGVCIAGELNISVILRMIKMSWTQYEQTQNQQQVFKVASDLVQRIGLLRERMLVAKKTLETTNVKFEEVMTSVEGRLGVLNSAQNIIKLGAKSDKRIPNDEQV
ncbi:MAG: DNA recombination protein RmuC [Prevotella sp.]|jgi:DNA recombination protein RmuC|nr:DNA recombination protein RmuC [Prevotella sp.]